MQINAISSLRTAAGSSDTTSSTTTTTTSSSQTLDQEDFLKLLAVQFQSQDPMSPMEDTEFIAQMAQFTALDQTKSLLTQVTAMNTKQDYVTANSYIGRTVTITNSDDTTVTGEVTGVDTSDGTAKLVIDGSTYDLSLVTYVEATSSTTTTATATSATKSGSTSS